MLPTLNLSILYNGYNYPQALELKDLLLQLLSKFMDLWSTIIWKEFEWFISIQPIPLILFLTVLYPHAEPIQILPSALILLSLEEGGNI